MDMVCNRVLKKPSLGSPRLQSKSKQMLKTSWPCVIFREKVSKRILKKP